MDNTVTLRPTALTDLDFVLGLERHVDNVPFIGQWTREESATRSLVMMIEAGKTGTVSIARR